MPTTSVQVDPRDVAAIEALEPQLKDLRQAIRAAKPALKRLLQAKYPGAEGLKPQFDFMVAREPWYDCDVAHTVRALEAFRVARGDVGAYEYTRGRQRGLSLEANVAEILAWKDGQEPVAESVRAYAGSIGVAQ